MGQLKGDIPDRLREAGPSTLACAFCILAMADFSIIYRMMPNVTTLTSRMGITIRRKKLL